MGVIVPEAEGEERMDICDIRCWSHPRDSTCGESGGLSVRGAAPAGVGAPLAKYALRRRPSLRRVAAGAGSLGRVHRVVLPHT